MLIKIVENTKFSTNVEKYTKNFKKGIDKRRSMCYNDQAFERGDIAKKKIVETEKKVRKK